MAATTSTTISRAPRWVLVLTGLVAAYGTYTVYSNLINSGPHTIRSQGLRRSNAVRQSRRHSPRHATNAPAFAVVQDPHYPEHYSKFGLIEARYDGTTYRHDLYGPQFDPNYLVQFYEVSPAALEDISKDLHIASVRIILTILNQRGSERALRATNDNDYSSLIPLVANLRRRNLDRLREHIHLLAGGSDVSEGQGRYAQFDETVVEAEFERFCALDGFDFEHVNPEGFDREGRAIDIQRMDLIVPASMVIDIGMDVALDILSAGSRNDRSRTGLGLDDERFDAETEVDGGREPGQGIKGLLYNIAEEQAKRQAYIHRGTRCDSCGEFPIRGVRWHCINCPDYDLCSACESQSHIVHQRTHVFAKVKIPIATLAQPHQVHDLWYPGDPQARWTPLKVATRKRLVAETGFEDVQVEAYYEQFGCLANVHYPNDALEIRIGIDRRAFNRALSSPKWPNPVSPSFLLDRMFVFYDTDNNGVIDFREFLSGLAYLRIPTKRREDSMKRILQGYDVDGDGFVSRRDFVRMFSAKYAVQKYIVREVVDAEEAEIVEATKYIVRSSQPISAAFQGETIPPGETRMPMRKHMDAFGDMQPDDETHGDVILPSGADQWTSETTNAVQARYRRIADLRNSDELRARFSNNAVLPVGSGSDGHAESQRYLVETDSRRTRGEPALSSTDERWQQDLLDALDASSTQGPHNDTEGTEGVAESATDNPAQDLGDEDEFAIPDYILDRGRAYDVPAAEKDFGTEVLFQVIQEAINELLDPIFAECEKLAEDVRTTRGERRKWRKQIDDYVHDKRVFQEELLNGAELDPLVATAMASRNGTRADGDRASSSSRDRREPEDRARRPDQESHLTSPQHEPQQAQSVTDLMLDTLQRRHEDSTNHNVAGSAADARRTAAGLQDEFRDEVVQEILDRPRAEVLPTDNAGIEALERNIQDAELDDLLAQAGYSVVYEPDGGARATRSAEQETALQEGVLGPEEHLSGHEELEDRHDLGADGGDDDDMPPLEPMSSRPDPPSPDWNREEGFFASSGSPAGSQEVPQPTNSRPANAAEAVDNDNNVASTATDGSMDSDRRNSGPPSAEPYEPTDSTREPSTSPHSAVSPPHHEPAQDATADTMRTSPSMPATPLPPPSPSSPTKEQGRTWQETQPPSQARLDHLHKLDLEEEEIRTRGAPGRLSYEEVRMRMMRDVTAAVTAQHGEGGLDGVVRLHSLVEGWLEWAGF